MVFLLRLRSSSGTKRLVFESSSASIQDVQLQIEDVTGVPVERQQLSTKPPMGKPQKLSVARPGSTSIQAAGLRHGDMLLLSEVHSGPAAAEAGEQAESVQFRKYMQGVKEQQRTGFHPTSQCKHGPRGRCMHCSPAEADPALAPERECRHAANAVCPNCSEYNKEAKEKGIKPKLACNHADSVFCPNCIPKAEGDEEELKKPVLCECNNAKGEWCIHCVPKAEQVRAHFWPYKYWVQEQKRANPQHWHEVSQVPSYKGKLPCPRGGHAPWPTGVCLECAPPNAHLRLQKYRHCDDISFEDVRGVQQFYSEWVASGTHQQRAGILFGRYIETKPNKSQPSRVRALVQAIYTPPQQSVPKGIRFQNDPKEATMHRVAMALGLQPVGWLVTTLPREGKKYGGKVFLSGSEVRQAARFQNRYKDKLGHSKFVTVVLEHSDQVAPEGYQVSDQCVALERDRVLASAADPLTLSQRVPRKGDLVPSVVYKNKPLRPGDEFLLDEFIVKVRVMSSKVPKPMFAHDTFPSNGVEGHAKAYFMQFAQEPLDKRLSDFNLLCWLSANVDADAVDAVCRSLRRGQAITGDVKNRIERALRNKQLL
eukprot:TRINITY_DN66140_c3_g1_i1.p1 TRINITY_DN66140_c3_g1~~TRINITY_DN66140_c3_g1_i1.p1  ORF type:complete len:595 (-),score=272.20 TRINITY_DN66140_c3_g1_i1:789-2573(-)